VKKSLVILFYSYALRQVPGLVDVTSFGYADVIGEQLHGDGVNMGASSSSTSGMTMQSSAIFADDVISLGDYGDDLPFPAFTSWILLTIFLVIGVAGRDKYDGEGLVDEGDRPMLHFGGRITFRMDIGDFLEL